MVSRANLTILVIILTAIVVWLVSFFHVPRVRDDTPTAPQTVTVSPQTTPTPLSLIEPVPEFRLRITKKAFGTFVTPQDSPVQPERFTGFHTGVDVEYEDITDNVPVVAVTDGTVVYKGTINGYGGVVIIRHDIGDGTYQVLYGHLDIRSVTVGIGQFVTRGQRLGNLGEGYSPETDGERKHLHFSISQRNTLDFRGYVSAMDELSDWIDPQNLFR